MYEKYKDPSLTPEERADDLLSKMTLREKAAQLDLRFLNNYATEIDPNHGCSVTATSDYDWERLKADIPDGLGYAHDNYSVPAVMNKLQKFMMENSRFGIPVIFTGEALHGIQGTRGTIFPIPTAVSATFDPECAYTSGRITAREASSLGIREVLAPNLDVARDPRWGRTEETYGEDTFLSSAMAAAMVKGHGGGDISRKDTVISEPKHYCVHGIPEGGLNCAPARVGIREVEECYLPVFESAIKAGALDVMVSYNSIDSDLMMTSEHYLKDVLKERLGLKGICRSDWGGIRKIRNDHHLTSSEKETIYLAKKNGLDCQGGSEYSNRFWVDTLEELVNEGRLDEENINDSCRRVLMLKFRTGLFENPYTDENEYREIINAPEHLDAALDIARKSVTLLKNDGILPLEKDRYKKIALIGPSTDKVRLGGYSCIPVGRHLKTLYECLKEALPDAEIIQCDGCCISEERELELKDQQHLSVATEKYTEDMERAVAIAESSDIVIFCGGDDTVSSGEGRDRSNVDLCGNQGKLIEMLASTGKPVILALVHGKPLAIKKESEECGAVLSCWFGGESGPQAITDVIMGKVNPAGRLPFSLPKDKTMLPCYYSMRPGGSNGYYESKTGPLYPFGHGLSYTEFEYSDLQIEVTGRTDMKVSLDVKNTGKVSGDEVVQIYIEDCESSVVTPDKLLKAFKRTTLEPGETKHLEFELGYNAFRLMNAKYEWKVEKGSFRILAGASSADIRLDGIAELEGD